MNSKQWGVLGFLVGQRLRDMRTVEIGLAAGLYETGTTNLIYSWEQLLGDEILEGGVVHVTDGVLTTGFTSFANESADVLAGDLVIPKGITVLGDNCFYKCVNLTGVTIPEGVTLIESDAFYKCTSLTKINIPSSVKDIGGEDGAVFYGCNALEKVYITDMSAWCEIDFEGGASNPLLYYAALYLNGTPIADVVIPDGVTEIKDYAFSSILGSTHIQSVHIPDSVTAIGQWSFSGNTGLTTITGGANVASVGRVAFGDCPCVSVDDQGLGIVQNWVVECSKEAIEVVIPEGVTIIAGLAFGSCTNLTSVTIPNSVFCIGECAFQYCPALSEITIPGSVTAIHHHAFASSALESITFEGTMEQWNAVELGTSWNGSAPATEVVCSDGTVAL